MQTNSQVEHWNIPNRSGYWHILPFYWWEDGHYKTFHKIRQVSLFNCCHVSFWQNILVIASMKSQFYMLLSWLYLRYLTSVMHDSGHVSDSGSIPIPAKIPWFHSDSDSSQHSLIPIPTTIPIIFKTLIPIQGLKCMILIPVPIPVQFSFLDSDSDSSQKWNHSGIGSDSGIGIVHHCLTSDCRLSTVATAVIRKRSGLFHLISWVGWGENFADLPRLFLFHWAHLYELPIAKIPAKLIWS